VVDEDNEIGVCSSVAEVEVTELVVCDSDSPIEAQIEDAEGEATTVVKEVDSLEEKEVVAAEVEGLEEKAVLMAVELTLQSSQGP
jgi:hypothetical protein